MPEKRVTLALQGGGSHGAFTWGLLERLLEDDRIVIEGISGSSAGAINGIVLAHGFATGGREGGIRLNTDAGFIAALRKEGRDRADVWLRRNFRHIGARSSFELARA